MALLSYAEVVAIDYVTTDSTVTLTPDQLSVLLQAIGLFVSPSAWSDYADYADDIDQAVAGIIAALSEDI